MREEAAPSIAGRYESELLRKGTRSTYMAPAISRLLMAFGVDFLNQFMPEIPGQLGNRSITTVYSSFEIRNDHKLFYHGGTWSTEGAVTQNPSLTDAYR